MHEAMRATVGWPLQQVMRREVKEEIKERGHPWYDDISLAL
jgi:hypothetical protein